MQTQDNLILTNCLTALDAEIRRIRLSGKQHVVTDGVITGGNDLFTVCRFTLKRPLDCPDNTAVTMVAGGREHKGTLMESHDRLITVALDGELSVAPSEALLAIELAEVLRATVKRLEDLRGAAELRADQLSRACRMIRGEAHARDGSLPIPASFGTCTQAQQDALQKLWSHDLGYLTGASDTGKTAILAQLAEAHASAGHRVLLVAPTNRAADTLTRALMHIPLESADAPTLLRLGKILDATLQRSHSAQIDSQCVINRANSALHSQIEGINTRLKEVRKALADSDEKIRLCETRTNLERQLRAAKNDLKRARGGVLGSTLRLFGLGGSHPHQVDMTKLSSTITTLQTGLKEVSGHLKGVNPSDLKTWHSELATREKELVERGWSCEHERTEVRERTLSSARIVVTTAGLAIQELPTLGSFDVTLIDDGATLPPPLLVALAAAATTQVVIAGDHHQLGPQAHSDHPSIERWYASDVFSLSGIADRLEAGEELPYAATLTTRRNSPPGITKLLNSSSYNNTLACESPSTPYESWPNALGIHSEGDCIALDTTSLDPTCITIRRSKSNPIHACIIAELCARLTRGAAAVEQHEIAVVAPYRPQIDLIAGLLIESSLSEILVIPAHAFRGVRRKLVILDLTESPPHALGGLAAPSSALSENQRLITHALNSASEKLIVVGNMHYLRRNLSDRNPLTKVLDALDMHASYTSASEWLAQLPVCDPTPLGLTLLPDDACGPALVNELKHARSEITLQVTELSQRRISLLLPLLRRKVQEGVIVRVALASGSSREAHRGRCDHDMLALLASEGIQTQRSPNHERTIACFDRRVLLMGSSAPLTHMVRKDSSLLGATSRLGATLLCRHVHQSGERSPSSTLLGGSDLALLCDEHQAETEGVTASA